MFQRIVTFPVDFHLNFPMDFQRHFPMDVQLLRDLVCNILPRQKNSGLDDLGHIVDTHLSIGVVARVQVEVDLREAAPP